MTNKCLEATSIELTPYGVLTYDNKFAQRIDWRESYKMYDCVSNTQVLRLKTGERKRLPLKRCFNCASGCLLPGITLCSGC